MKLTRKDIQFIIICVGAAALVVIAAHFLRASFGSHSDNYHPQGRQQQTQENATGGEVMLIDLGLAPANTALQIEQEKQSPGGNELWEKRDQHIKNERFTRSHVAENGSYYGEISKTTDRPKTVHVQGYYRKDGTYVRGHYRSRPRR